MAPRVLIRCDASPAIGVGHVMRDLVLATQLDAVDFAVDFAVYELPPYLAEIIRERGYGLYRLEDPEIGTLIARADGYDWLVLDHYGVGEAQERQIRAALNLRLLVFDDTFRRHDADAVLNHGLQVRPGAYRGLVPEGCRVLCGSTYTLLERSFFAPSRRRVRRRPMRRVLITLGGSDVKQRSAVLARLLKRMDPKWAITIVTTSANPKSETLVKQGVSQGFRVVRDTNAMAELMAAHDLVVTASGGTLFEAMALGKPFINLPVASNQEGIVRYLKRRKLRTTLERVSFRDLRNTLHYLQTNGPRVGRELAKFRFRPNRTALAMKAMS